MAGDGLDREAVRRRAERAREAALTGNRYWWPSLRSAALDVCADVPALLDALEAAEARLRAARFVADHWRRHALASDVPLAAHPLCMVTAALDGETDPAQCGVGDDGAAGFAAVLRTEGGEASRG